jgi:hypothetical protein
MFSEYTRPHPSDSDTPESKFRFGMMLAELWHDWFEAMSEVAYQTHRACEFLAEHKGFSNGRYGPFDAGSSRNPFEGLNGSFDMDKLKECLQSMDPAEAAQVMHAVQIMQAMDALRKSRRSRANEEEGAAW